MKIVILNGPNINLLGEREPEVYGEKTWKEIEEKINGYCNSLDICVDVFQSNTEGEIINFVQQNYNDWDAIVINPASLTINGYGLLECLLAIKKPFIEVHMSNIYLRGGWHSKSIFSAHSLGVIVGFKELVYVYSVGILKDYLNKLEEVENG